MTQESSIFLATDYSEQVKSAEQYAFEFAKETNSFLTIIHVHDLPFSLPAEANAYVKETERIRKHELQKLKLHCEATIHDLKIKLNEIKWESLVLEGAIGKEISKEADRSKPNLIITGTHASKGFISFFENSHTWEIIKKTNVPILSVPPNYPIKEIKKIVFATEFKEGEIPGLNYLVDFASGFKAEIIVLHISNQTITDEFEKNMFEKFKTEIYDKIDYEKLYLRLIHSDDIVGGINEYCDSVKADWLAMSHSKPALLKRLFINKKSVTKELVLQSHIPLLSLPDSFISEREKKTESHSKISAIDKRND